MLVQTTRSAPVSDLMWGELSVFLTGVFLVPADVFKSRACMHAKADDLKHANYATSPLPWKYLFKTKHLFM